MAGGSGDTSKSLYLTSLLIVIVLSPMFFVYMAADQSVRALFVCFIARVTYVCINVVLLLNLEGIACFSHEAK